MQRQRPLAHPAARWSRVHSSLSVVVVVVLSGAALGCAGNLDPSLLTGGAGSGGPGTAGTTGGGGTTGATACDAPGMVFISGGCATVGCHAAPTATIPSAGGLDLASAGVAGRLLGKPTAGATNAPCASNTTPYLVTASNPATGFLFDKLKNPPPCGAQMPELPPALTPARIDCLNSWATALTTGAITP